MEPQTLKNQNIILEVLQEQCASWNASKKKRSTNANLYPMCEVDIAHLHHQFCQCKFARDCWQSPG